MSPWLKPWISIQFNLQRHVKSRLKKHVVYSEECPFHPVPVTATIKWSDKFISRSEENFNQSRAWICHCDLLRNLMRFLSLFLTVEIWNFMNIDSWFLYLHGYQTWLKFIKGVSIHCVTQKDGEGWFQSICNFIWDFYGFSLINGEGEFENSSNPVT